MENLINFLLTCVILWAAGQLFPENVQVESLGTVVLVALLTVVVEMVVILVTVAVMALVSQVESTWARVAMVAGSVVALACSTLIAVVILSGRVPGFNVRGLGAKVLLSFAMTLVSGTVRPHATVKKERTE